MILVSQMHPLSSYRCVPGFIGGSPVKISLSLKSVGVYLVFCQNQRLLRFTTTVSTEMSLFGLDTGISEPPTSTSSTKFLVAAVNMARLEAARFPKNTIRLTHDSVRLFNFEQI